jgi:hypothetical protein
LKKQAKLMGIDPADMIKQQNDDANDSTNIIGEFD